MINRCMNINEPVFFIACAIEDDYEVDLVPVTFHTKDLDEALRLASCVADFPEKHLMIAYDNNIDKVFPNF
jgi:hypothetical protein